MAWLYLILAGGLEVFWATCLKLSHGFTVFKFTALTIVGMVFSFLFLAQATKVLPIGTSYAIWTGIGALGAVIVGVILFKEPMSLLRGFFVLLLIAGIIGIKLTSAH
ncbi:MAG TPA: multidrug efflux SMR transporter [Firmicutes bacterium]|nr:multidrug efflux SMR transporter [Bacillota bacterium]